MANPSSQRQYLLQRLQNATSMREAQQIQEELRYLENMMVMQPMMMPSMSPWIGMDWGAEPSKPQPPLPEEHIVSAVIGHRAWNVPLFVDELRSVAKASKWKPYERFEAACESPQCAGVSCRCGIYAFKKMESVQTEYKQTDRSKRYVYGECWLWGRVLECKEGYRAQFAYPKSFVNTGAIAKRMSEVFGVKLI